MIISFKRTGGVGGTKLHVTVDTDELMTTESAKIVALVNRLPPPPPPPAPNTGRADRFAYDITITDGATVRTLTLPEPLAGAGAELVDKLMDKARQIQAK